MARAKKAETNGNGNNGNGANLGFEQTLWAAADKMRGHMDAAEYKHVALGLIFLKPTLCKAGFKVMYLAIQNISKKWTMPI